MTVKISRYTIGITATLSLAWLVTLTGHWWIGMAMLTAWIVLEGIEVGAHFD